jgi:type II secretory pathway pseudopilin PulG
MQLNRKNRHRKQGGYVLLAVLFVLTVLIIAMAAAAPRIATARQREKENELVRRGQQYAIAIRRFYKKFGRYPSSVDQLENTNNIRFLRRRYLDPLTGKDDWTPIQFGQARPALGFFGQKVVTTGGLSPSGPGLGPSTIGTGANSGLSPGTNSGFGPAANSTFGSSGSNNTSTPFGSSASTSSNSPGTSTNSPSGAGGTASGPAGTASNPLSTDQLSGKTFGGGAIVGVSIPSQKESLKQYQQQKHYNEWQFVYDPTMDPTLRGAGIAAGGTGLPGATGLNPTQNPGGFSSTPFGNSSTFGGSTNQQQPTTQPTSPMPH